jgi:putative lipoprotein
MSMKMIWYGMAMASVGMCAAMTVLSARVAAQTPENNVRKAVPWKQFSYSCEGGKKVKVYLRGDVAKVTYGDETYLMKQTRSADGNRYSDGKVVWWGKGNGGFLQEDTPDGNGAMIVKDCMLAEPSVGSHEDTITGTVTYRERMALPSNALIEVQLLDTSLADAPAKVITEDKITLGERQVPVPYVLKFDAAKIDSRHRYAVSAKIIVDGQLRFVSEQAHPAIIAGTSADVNLVLKSVGK